MLSKVLDFLKMFEINVYSLDYKKYTENSIHHYTVIKSPK